MFSEEEGVEEAGMVRQTMVLRTLRLLTVYMKSVRTEEEKREILAMMEDLRGFGLMPYHLEPRFAEHPFPDLETIAACRNQCPGTPGAQARLDEWNRAVAEESRYLTEMGPASPRMSLLMGRTPRTTSLDTIGQMRIYTVAVTLPGRFFPPLVNEQALRLRALVDAYGDGSRELPAFEEAFHHAVRARSHSDSVTVAAGIVRSVGMEGFPRGRGGLYNPHDHVVEVVEPGGSEHFIDILVRIMDEFREGMTKWLWNRDLEPQGLARVPPFKVVSFEEYDSWRRDPARLSQQGAACQYARRINFQF